MPDREFTDRSRHHPFEGDVGKGKGALRPRETGMRLETAVGH